MIELPASLATWAPQLVALPDDVALVVAPWLGRLSLAIGALATSARHGSGDPDGYRGLARRGSYERLVASEWALAELFPDEFVRRAAGGEHLFFELARSEPRASHRSVAIVSAGPAQLGAPRLAHIAVLIALARRAATAGASFVWGVLEDREHRLHGVLDGASLQALLAARTARAAPPDAFAEWMRALGDAPADDVWAIGADEDVARAGGSWIAVRDVLVPNTSALDVEVARRGHRAQLRLELPPAEQCVRILRRPVGRGPVPSRVAIAHERTFDVRFAHSGRKLIVQLANGAWETWPVPSSAREPLGKPRVWRSPSDRAVLAVGIGRRSIFAVTSKLGDPLVLELQTGSASTLLPSSVATPIAGPLTDHWSQPPATCALVHLRTRDLVIPLFQRLIVVPNVSLGSPPPSESAYLLTAASVHASALFRDRVVWAERDDDGDGPVRIMEGTSSGNQRHASVDVVGAPHVMFGPGQGSGSWIAGIAMGDDRTQIVGPGLAPVTLSAPNVVGVCMRGAQPALLTRPHAHRLALVVGDRRELLPPSNEPILKVVTCASSPNVAWVTATGEVVVCALDPHAVLFRRALGAPP